MNRLIHISKTDIEQGRRCSGTNCMVARRLGLVFKTHLVYASYNALGPNGSLQAYAFIKGEQYAMSNAAAQKMSDFDDGKPVSPFAFRLKKVAE